MKKKKLLITLFTAGVLVGSFSFTINEKKNSPFALALTNIEALAYGELAGGTIPCYWNYDTPAWFVDDEYKVVCRDAKTLEVCKQIKGHNFGNSAYCTPK